MDLAILMTCFNRKATTVEALRALQTAIGDSLAYRVFLLDDASADGTAEAVAQEFPEVELISGSGNHYWNGGMRIAWTHALDCNSRFYLWLNDDVHLVSAAISSLLKTYAAASGHFGAKTIIIGRTIDPSTGRTTYGGYKRVKGPSRLRFRHLEPGEFECETMNGNCVLFPSTVVADVGLNSGKFSHHSGDIDYGLRAKLAGYKLIELKEPVAFLKANEQNYNADVRLTIKTAKFIFFHPKGIPIGEWFYFCKKHGGALWPANFLWRYIRSLRVQ